MLTKTPCGFLKYPKQLKVAQTSAFINCSGHRFIYLWLRKEFPAQKISKEQPSPVLHGYLSQLALPFLILMLMQFKQPNPAFFYLCNKPIFRSLSCVSLNHNILTEEKNLFFFFFTPGDREGRRKKKKAYYKNPIFLFVMPNSSPSESCVNLNIS